MTASRKTTPPRARQRAVALVAAGVLALGSGTAAAAASSAPTGEEVSVTGGTEPRLAGPGSDHGDTPAGIDADALLQRIRGADAHSSADRAPSDRAVRVRESSAGDNDRLGGAQTVPRPTAGQDHEVQIRGRLSTRPVKRSAEPASTEDDGAIPLARSLRLGQGRRAISTTGLIGDGPHGSQGTKSGDYDFYRFRAKAGDTLTVDIDPGDALLPQAYLYDAKGALLVGAQDLAGTGDVHLFQPITETDTYYLAIGTFLPKDPFDSGSGPAVITEGPYELDLTLRGPSEADTDLYAIPLKKGEVIGATANGASRRIAVHDSRGRVLQGSQADIGAIYPKRSPLPRGGRATTNYVVDRTGIYHIAVADGAGKYSVTLGLRNTAERPQQTVWLDFTGPTFDNRVFGASVTSPGVKTVSPMRNFLPAWGLQTSDESAVIEATTNRIKQILRRDIPGSNVRVVNSSQEPDLFGKPGVSRVIIGGTVEEVGGTDAFGLSESIDPGNFARAETAIVMPDRMSSLVDPRSLLPFLTDGSDRVRAVAQALGNTAGHEIGHFLGNYHTDDNDKATNVMNTGYRLHFFAVGEDRVAGTADDDRIAMRASRYDPLQGLVGTESTAARTWVALR